AADEDEEDESEDKLRGAVRNQVSDHEWEEALDASIQKTASAYTRLPSAVSKNHILRIIMAVLVFALAGMIPAILLSVFSYGLSEFSASVMLSGFREAQFLQVLLFMLQEVANAGELEFSTIDQEPLNPDITTSVVIKDFSHVKKDAVYIKSLLQKSFDFYNLLSSVLLESSNVPDGWTPDSKLSIDVKRADPEVAFVAFSKGPYQCPFDNETLCENPNRIYNYHTYVGFDLLNAHFEKYMKFFLTQDGKPQLASTEEFLFILTSANFDLRKQYDQFTTEFLARMNGSVNTFTIVNLVCMIVQVVLYILTLFLSVLPLKATLNTITNTTNKLHTLIPNNAQYSAEFEEEIWTGVHQFDAGRKKLYDLSMLIVDSIQQFMAHTEVHSLTMELLQQTKIQFTAEEKMMTQVSFTEDLMKKHTSEHLLLRQRMTTLCDNLTNRDDAIVFGALPLFQGLLSNHFTGLDKDFAKFFAKETGLEIDRPVDDQIADVFAIDEQEEMNR
ncbi:MAG: hypothetical protein EZS28_032675, partial [Streblomastix strix]